MIIWRIIYNAVLNLVTDNTPLNKNTQMEMIVIIIKIWIVI